MVPGAPLDDAPVRVDGKDAWLLHQLGGRFAVLVYVNAALDDAMLEALRRVEAHALAPEIVLVTAPGTVIDTTWRVLEDSARRVAERLDARHGTTYLIRPDQHVAARRRKADAAELANSLARATANSPSATEVEAR
jgi:3-(3-hydroxy-phenyl)propionate hydroxylase